MKTFYFKRNNGELYQDSWHDTPEAVLNELVPGYERITRKEYRERKNALREREKQTTYSPMDERYEPSDEV